MQCLWGCAILSFLTRGGIGLPAGCVIMVANSDTIGGRPGLGWMSVDALII